MESLIKTVVALMELLRARKSEGQSLGTWMNRCLRDNLALRGISLDLGPDYLC